MPTMENGRALVRFLTISPQPFAQDVGILKQSFEAQQAAVPSTNLARDSGHGQAMCCSVAG